MEYSIGLAKEETAGPVVAAGMARRSGGRNILIVDEDASLGNFLSQELQAEAFAVEVLQDGESALRAIEEDARHDLVILDLDLPRLDGISLIRRVRAGEAAAADAGIDGARPGGG